MQIGLLAVIRLFSGFDRHFCGMSCSTSNSCSGASIAACLSQIWEHHMISGGNPTGVMDFFMNNPNVYVQKRGEGECTLSVLEILTTVASSNTYGYDPRSWLGGRYDASSRWTDIVAAETGWTVCNMGQNGREIPTTAPTFPEDTDLLIVMLGTNDLLQGCSAESAIGKLEGFLAALSLLRDRILLIAPPPMMLGEWVPSQQLVNASKNFTRCCRELAEQMGIQFADAGRWNISLTYDGVHFTEQGHKAFAAGLLEELK